MTDAEVIEETTALLKAARRVMKAEFSPILSENIDATVNLARLMHDIASSTTAKESS